MKKIYCLSEEQFRVYVKKAVQKKGVTGENLLMSLDRRLDEVVYKAGFAISQKQARQLVGHSHVLVNGKRVSAPSYEVKEGDVVEIREKSRKLLPVLAAIEGVKRKEIPQWLEVDAGNFKSVIKRLPLRSDVTVPVQENLIVEYYSR